MLCVLLCLLLLSTGAYILMRNRGGSFTEGVIKSTQYHFLLVKPLMHLKFILWNKIHGSSVGVLHLAWFKHVSFFPVLSNLSFLAPSALPRGHYSSWVWSNAMTDSIQGTSWNVRRAFFLFYCHPLFQMLVVVFLCRCVSLFVPSSSCVYLKSLIWNTPTSPQFGVCIPLIGTNPSWNLRIRLQRPSIHYCHPHPENPSLCCDVIFVYIAPYVAEYTSSAAPQTIQSYQEREVWA